MKTLPWSQACGALIAAFAGLCGLQAADAAASADVANQEIIRLPPFVTSALRIDRSPWRYARVGDFEFLTRADDDETIEVLQALQSGVALEDQVIPAGWLAGPAVPYTVIVDNADLATVAGTPARANPMQFDQPADAVAWHQYAGTARQTSERYGASDHDTYAINCNVHGLAVDGLNGTVTLERLARSTPPLPIWLVVGLMGRTSGVFRESFSFHPDRGRTGVLLGETSFSGQAVVGPGLLWVSPVETTRLLKQIKEDRENHWPTRVTMLPLDELFAEAPPPADKLALWESEAALLVHWALFGPERKGHGRAALIALVERARRAPVSEAMFVECFGMTYGKMHAVLTAYLVQHLQDVTTVKVVLNTPFDTPVFKRATSDQIGRILGDWLRMRAANLKEGDPGMSRQLLAAANRALERAYRLDNGLPPDVDPSGRGTEPRSTTQRDEGPTVKLSPVVITADHIRDPLLLAVYGLYEHQFGAVEKARELLEKAEQSRGLMDGAAKAPAPRPEALRVLAQLRYDEAIANPASSERRLNISQATSILEPLRICLGQDPGSNAYLLFVDTWEHCDTDPSPADMAVVTEAVRRFPRNARLVYRAARLSARAGFAAEARAFLDQGLPFTTDQTRSAFLQLRGSLPHP